MRSGRRCLTRRSLLTLLALLLIAAVPLLPAAFAGHFPRTHEGPRYGSLTLLFADAIRHGYPYPRWLPDLASGMGYPTFVFYQPLFFYVAAACLALPGMGASAAPFVACYAFAIAGAGGAYALAGPRSSRLASLAVATLFLITPFAYVELYVRGDLSEFAAMMLTPWPLASLIAADRRMRCGRPAVAPLLHASFGIAAIVLAHPAVAMLFVPLLLLLGVARACVLSRPLRTRWLIALVCTFAIAAALSSAYWFVVFQCRGYVQLERAVIGGYAAREHVVGPMQLISTAWGFGLSTARSTGLPDGMSFQLGAPHLLIALVGFACAFRRPWATAAACAYALLTVAMMPIADPIWSASSALRFVQFPWRLLAVVAALQCLLAVGLVQRLGRRRSALVLWLAVFASAGWYHAMFRASPEPFDHGDGRSFTLTWRQADAAIAADVRALPAMRQTYALMNEFDPIWARDATTPRGEGPMLLGRAAIRFDAASTPYRIDARVDSSVADAVLINQFYFPGFRVEVNGAAVPDDVLRDDVMPDGRMIVAIPAGASRVVAYYDGPPGWATRTVASALIVAAGTWGLTRATRPIGVTSASSPSR